MRIGIDIGGTFTDLVAVTDEGIVVRKVSSTPDDPSRAFADALRRAPAGTHEVLHGTTVGTNAVITRTGAELAFVTTRGFRHILHLARQDRPKLYDLKGHRSPALVRTSHCVGVGERIGPHGEIVRELDEDAARWALEEIRGVDGVAVCLLHAYADPTHERRVAELVAEVLGPDVSISVSSDVLPEFREYERASTTALNAYVQPVVSRYLRRVADAARGSGLAVMWSGGGLRGIEQTIASPVHTLYSGPAAGVLGATWAAAACGFRDLVTLDMGGTSADVALVDDARPAVAEESSIDGLPFRTPCLDVVSVGAGGGSIAWVDDGGALRVGPRSAGADPGPASYGRGGTEATVTDAQVALGYLGEGGLAGGELALDRPGAERALERLGAAVGMSTVDVARGVLRVVRATMARAIRSVSVERGKDVRRYVLVAFGGAGPLHATALARELQIGTVVVPPVPGALAALGLLVASRRADASVTHPMEAGAPNDRELASLLARLTNDVLADLEAEGVHADGASIERFVDCRYHGQSHELRISVGAESSFEEIVGAFHEAHRQRYGFDRPDVAVEAVTFRAAALGPPGEVMAARPSGTVVASSSTRTIDGVGVPVYERGELPVGTELRGPALVVELDSTTWLDASSSLSVHRSGALVIDVPPTDDGR